MLYLALGNKYDLQPYHGILSAEPMVFSANASYTGAIAASATGWLDLSDVYGQFSAGLCIERAEEQLVLVFLNDGKARSFRIEK